MKIFSLQREVLKRSRLEWCQTLDEGDEIIIPEPFYANYNGFAISAGVVIKPITSHIENGFALRRFLNLKNSSRLGQRPFSFAIRITPQAISYPKQELEQLREIVLDHNLFLFVDEVYVSLSMTGRNISRCWIFQVLKKTWSWLIQCQKDFPCAVHA